MITKKTRIAVGASVVGALVIGVILFVSMDFRSPELGQAVLEEASKAVGMKLTADGFHLNLLRGLILEDVEATWRFPSGRFQARIEEMVFEHRLLPLLSGKVVIERVVVKRPRLNLVATRSGSPSMRAETRTRKKDQSGGPERQPPAIQPPTDRFVLEVAELRLEDAVISGFGDAPTVKGIDGVLRQLNFHAGALSPLHGLDARGELRIKEIVLGSTRVVELAGNLVAGEGRLSLDRLGFTTHGGAFSGTMTIDFNSIPFAYTFRLKGGPLDVAAWMGSDDRGALGLGFLELEAEGFGADSKNVKGTGKLTLESGTLPSTPVFALIAEVLGGNSLAGSRYRTTEAVFRIERNELFLEPFQLDADEAGLNLSGSVDLDGPLALSLMLRVPREGLDVPDHVQDTLATESGWIAIPFQVTGTVEDPVVRLDTEALNLQ